MMRLLSAALFTLCAGSLCLAQAPSPEFVEGKRLWLNNEFERAYHLLRLAREKPYGRTLQTDYMLGTAACRLPRREGRMRGAEFLEWIKYRSGYELTPESDEMLAKEIQLCQQSALTPPMSLPGTQPVLLQVGTVVSLRGKTFNIEIDTLPVRTRSAAPTEVNESEIRERLVPLGNREEAARQVARYDPASRTRVFQRFVISSAAQHTDAQLARLNDQLERYLRFFSTRYGVTLPEYYITVRLVPSLADLANASSTLHGMPLARATIGYSFRDDLSIVALIPGETYGTVFHELFHLAARSNFGDIPAWLDEGMAALYEVSQLRGDEVIGLPNWRAEVLKKDPRGIPSIRMLLEGKWPPGLSRRSTPEDDRNYLLRYRTSSTQTKPEHVEPMFPATARYFVLYLQEKRWLAGFYAAVQRYSASDEFSGSAADVIGLLEKTTGLPLDRVQTNFERWLAQQGIRPAR